jgi:SRSO17 transposase
MVQSQAQSYFQRSLSSFTRFLGESPWTAQDLVQIALQRFFRVLRIKARSILFFIVDDTIIQKTGKKIPGCAWYKDHAQQMANVFGHQWVLGAMLYKDFLLPLAARLYHPKGIRGCGSFQTKITMVKRMIQSLQLPVPCKLYVLADSWYWAKTLVQTCQSRGYHMISQLKSNSVILLQGQRTRVTQIQANASAYRQVSLCLYGKDKTLKIAKFIGTIKGIGKVALVIVKEKRTKIRYLVCTNTRLPAIEVIKYYAKRWKIEQMIKDLKQCLGFGHYQVRTLQAIQHHAALALLSYSFLVFFAILALSKDKGATSYMSIRRLAFLVRRDIFIENIKVTLRTMRIQFKQNILDAYLEKLCP